MRSAAFANQTHHRVVDRHDVIAVEKTAACLAPAIVWLARAVKVERPFAPRLHLDCARFAGRDGA